MHRRTCVVALSVVLVSSAFAGAQVNLRPSRAPIVTAENERWYMAGEPIMFAGNVYFPAGPRVFFNPYEMVRSGDYRGIPLYTRTTLEPYSVVFVPLGGGLMHPYERRRAGEMAGTVGSTTPSFPVTRSSEETGEVLLQAAAPPMVAAPLIGLEPEPRPSGSPLPTLSGVPIELPRPPVLSRPNSLNAVFVEYRGRRYVSKGPVVRFDPTQFVRIGEYDGFDVYAEKGASNLTIYIPVARGASDFVAPYVIK